MVDQQTTLLFLVLDFWTDIIIIYQIYFVQVFALWVQACKTLLDNNFILYQRLTLCSFQFELVF